MEKRLDVILNEMYGFTSRTLAKDAIKENRIQVNGKTITKPAFLVSEEDNITIIPKEHEFASRGGNKLFDALTTWNIDITNNVVLDVGASTGGFSDVCLQSNARYVYAVDIGKDQLIERLRNDPRIKCMEGVNCRYLTKDMFDQKIDFVCMDVSFISIKKIIDALLNVCENPCQFVFLIKPQFEVGKTHIGKNGIVKDKKVHIQLLEEFMQYFQMKGFSIHHLKKSATIGRDGNQEYLVHLSLSDKRNVPSFSIHSIVKD